MTVEKSKKSEILSTVKQDLQEEQNWEKGLITIAENASLLEFEGCGIFLVNPVKETLDCYLGRGVYPPDNRISVQLKETACIGVRCVLEKTTLHKRTQYREGNQTYKPQFHLWVPVIVQDKVFGALAVERVKKESITDEDVRNLETLAGMCADFIERTKIPINPVPEKLFRKKTKHQLDSNIYVIVEKKPEKSYKIFRNLVTHGIPGLVVSRMHPKRIRKKYKLMKTPMLWLSRSEIELSMHPNDFSKMYYTFMEFMTKSDQSVILLDGIEYLIINTSFETVLEYLKELKDILAITNSRLVIPLHKGTLSLKEYNALDEEFTILESN
ncbi:MAG: DUF835 domain-containing protein [Theionarchaea archaeon]|nr:DUF835 domain-containing protein [Theionarchaea archaeon]